MTNKKYYITTSIPYANGAPHLGHAMEFVLADIFSRYHKQKDEDVFFSTGSDEHGGKVMEKASQLGLSTKDYVDQISQLFKDLANELDVEYSKFIRTTDDDHEKRVALIWQSLQEEYIYKGTYHGVYEQKEEIFLTKEEARKIAKTDPKRYQGMVEIEEDNYFFKLSLFNERILESIKKNELLITPKTKRNEIISILENGLKDISISRPVEKIPWGIPVPGDDTQTVYVWFEALMNYITTLGYPDSPKMNRYWPASVQVVGKDINRFHSIIWPAILMGLGLELPKVVYVHGFINDANGDIMSKSRGNGVAPSEIVDKYGVDMFRYYIAKHVQAGEDNDFSWERYETIYNTELANELGNLVQRTANMIYRYEDGMLGKLPESSHDEAPYHEAVEAFVLEKAIDYVWGLIRGLNQYIEDEKPWQLAKQRTESEHLQEVLAYLACSILQISNLLRPVMPATSEAIDKLFNSDSIGSDIPQLFPKINNYTEARKQ